MTTKHSLPVAKSRTAVTKKKHLVKNATKETIIHLV